jgi:hypothetical protein
MTSIISKSIEEYSEEISRNGTRRKQIIKKEFQND